MGNCVMMNESKKQLYMAILDQVVDRDGGFHMSKMTEAEQHILAECLADDYLQAIKYIDSLGLTGGQKIELEEEIEDNINLIESLKRLPVEFETTEDLFEIIESQQEMQEIEDYNYFILCALRLS